MDVSVEGYRAETFTECLSGPFQPSPSGPFSTPLPSLSPLCQAWRAWTRRGEMEASRDNRGIAKQILALRSEQAKLHGFRSFAE